MKIKNEINIREIGLKEGVEGESQAKCGKQGTRLVKSFLRISVVKIFKIFKKFLLFVA